MEGYEYKKYKNILALITNAEAASKTNTMYIYIYQKLKRSLRDGHIKTHGNCIEIFRLAWPSLSCVHKHLLSFD